MCVCGGGDRVEDMDQAVSDNVDDGESLGHTLLAQQLSNGCLTKIPRKL